MHIVFPRYCRYIKVTREEGKLSMTESKGSFSRRAFIATAAMSAATLSLGGCTSNAPEDTENSSSSKLPSKWDYEADVVVVGGGCAGFMAACAAREQNVDVILLEKMSNVGGDTAVSGQTIQGIWPERVKELFGVDDSIEAYMEDWKKSHPHTTKGRRGEPLGSEFPYSQREIDLLPETYEWMEAAGVKWEATAPVSPTYIYPQPVWDTVFPRSWSAKETGIMAPLQSKGEDLGVEILMETQATQLIVDETGRVVGIYAKDDAENRIALKARKAVVLAGGSFCGNRSMMMRYLPYPQAQVYSAGGFGSTGDAINMAWEIGAALKEMDLGSHWIVEESLSGAMTWFLYMSQFGGKEGEMAVGDTPHVLINFDGKRFMSETMGYKWTGLGVAEQKYHEAYMVFDSANQMAAEMAIATEPNPLLLLQADTLMDLANLMKVPSNTMLEEITKYNSYVDQGADPDFNRHMEKVTRVETPPFYALLLRPRPYTTYGGIDVDIDSHVLDTQGTPIKGLYAAGTCTYCFCESEGLYYIGGIAQGSTFGRQAGKNAAAETAWS
jgi:succinate dehydrogenase/fumarate reductase flavoprotein subunit